MGGYITYKAVTLEPRLRAAVCIVASPEWLPGVLENFTEGSPHLQLERFDRIRLLSQTAGRDKVVPSRYMRAFHERLSDKYDNVRRTLCLSRVSQVRPYAGE